MFVEKIDKSVYEVLDDLTQATDGHKFGTHLVGAINKRETIDVFPLEVLNLINVLKKTIPAKVEWNEREQKLLYNYNEEKWQKVDAQTIKIIES